MPPVVLAQALEDVAKRRPCPSRQEDVIQSADLVLVAAQRDGLEEASDRVARCARVESLGRSDRPSVAADSVEEQLLVGRRREVEAGINIFRKVGDVVNQPDDWVGYADVSDSDDSTAV